MNKRSEQRNKMRNKYAILKNKINKSNKGQDPYGIPNVNFSVLEHYDNTNTDLVRLANLKQQRVERGFDDTECWNLDYTIAAFILPRLKVFKQDTNGYPGVEPMDTPEKWDAALDEMIWAFDYIVNEDKYIDELEEKYHITWNSVDPHKINKDFLKGNIGGPSALPDEERKAYYKDREALEERKDKGLKLFAEWFNSLWW